MIERGEIDDRDDRLDPINFFFPPLSSPPSLARIKSSKSTFRLHCRPLLNHPFHLWKSFLSLSLFLLSLIFRPRRVSLGIVKRHLFFFLNSITSRRWRKEDVRIRKGSGEAGRDWLGASSRKRVCLVSQFSGGGACVPFICIIQLVS